MEILICKTDLSCFKISSNLYDILYQTKMVLADQSIFSVFAFIGVVVIPLHQTNPTGILRHQPRALACLNQSDMALFGLPG